MCAWRSSWVARRSVEPDRFIGSSSGLGAGTDRAFAGAAGAAGDPPSDPVCAAHEAAAKTKAAVDTMAAARAATRGPRRLVVLFMVVPLHAVFWAVVVWRSRRRRVTCMERPPGRPVDTDGCAEISACPAVPCGVTVELSAGEGGQHVSRGRV